MLNINSGFNTNKTSATTNGATTEGNKKPEDKKQEELLIAPGSLGNVKGDVFVPSAQSTNTDNKGVNDETLVERTPDGFSPNQINTVEARVISAVKETLEGENNTEVTQKEIQKDVQQATAKVIESETEKVDITNNQTMVLSNAALYAKIAEAMIK